MIRITLLILITLSLSTPLIGQTLKGVVKDSKSKEALIGATVAAKGLNIGASTDLDGKFSLDGLTTTPVTLVVSFIGFDTREIIVNNLTENITIYLASSQKALKEVSVVESRLTEKQRESALTVEAMDIIAIRQSPAASFYDGLGTLKGVDVTAASLGFKVVNTRGFNSTSPVRSLQIIDGVDNQSPGLNFSLGNFLGCSELDLLKVDLIVGASSAFYGPNAFNGVISMTTRSPFIKPGLEFSYKTGSRNLRETAIRYATVLKNKSGEEKIGMKFNICYFTARDWEADNRSATPQSRDDIYNPGGYDAVNVYGDEYYSGGDFTGVPRIFPGAGVIYRTGYAEKDIVDYNTRNLKLNSAIHYKIAKQTELIASSNFGYGTTVYQGDNRYSLKDIQFFQNRIELRKENKYFVRAYYTNEDAGKSYDAFFTALLLQNSVKDNADWVDDYLFELNKKFFLDAPNYQGYPQAPVQTNPPMPPEQFSALYTAYLASINPFLLNNYYDSLILYHGNAEAFANGIGQPTKGNQAYLIPGTAAFDSALTSITSRETFAGGGSRFFDRSALAHIHAEYKFDIDSFLFTTGANFRQYLPNSRGTIFSDTSGREIKLHEYGIYFGVDKKIMYDKVKLNLAMRMDKNQNFDYLFSPALSAIYNPDDKNTLRVSLSSAIRNPTLADQYLYYQVGRATLIGNIDGYDSLVTIQSFINALNYQNNDTLEYFNVAAVQPEEVKTFELGYRTTLFKKLFIDMNAYYSSYTNFIGYKLGADVSLVPGLPQPYLNNIYRVASNSKDRVTTAGFSFGMSYYFSKYYTLNGNWSWNELDRHGSTDPLIPAFNTPKNKFNLGLTGQDIENKIGNNWGFGINYKYVQGFLFEGSPQFTGEIDDYGLLDVQVNKKFPEIKTTFKVGCTNILENLHYEVYGGPLIGRLMYFQLMLELN
ncbi:MAG: TonB-dependent receptor [Bacteroidetes bacterium]|nr:TonB-dependent receptor [Bacteroidota bacterium]